MCVCVCVCGLRRIIDSLAAAGIVDFCADSAAVTARAETGIMTRNLVKFETMKLLLGLSVRSTLSQVRWRRRRVCSSSEDS